MADETISEMHHAQHVQPTHDDIAVAAYYMWLKQTELPDYTAQMGEEMAVTNWLIAEQALQKECDIPASASTIPLSEV